MKKSFIEASIFGVGIGSFVVLATLAPACGGDANKQVKAPSAEAGAGTPVETQGGSEVGVVDQQGGSELTGSARSAYERGWKAWLEGDLQTAKKQFQEAAAADPKAPSPHYSLGVVLERLGDKSGAQMEYRSAFTLKPDYEFAIGAYALMLANSGSKSEAETFMADKKAKYPNSARIATYYADVKSINGDHGTAQQLAQDALRMDPDFKEAMVCIARDNYRARKMELAKYALQAILEGFGDQSPPRDKDNAEAHLLRGLIAKEEGKRPLAMKDFEAAVRRRPDLVEGLIQLGVMRLEAGNANEALPLLEGATRFAPNNANAHLNLGDCYRLLGRIPDARKEFDTALAQDSSLAMAHYNLGLLYLFSPNVPGTNAKEQVAIAIKELELFKQTRGAKSLPGSAGDDVDELLSRAKAKQNDLNQAAAPAAPAGATPPPATSAGGAAPKK
jgi:tetratricopeptide (TPR) repeat protein